MVQICFNVGQICNIFFDIMQIFTGLWSINIVRQSSSLSLCSKSDREIEGVSPCSKCVVDVDGFVATSIIRSGPELIFGNKYIPE